MREGPGESGIEPIRLTEDGEKRLGISFVRPDYIKLRQFESLLEEWARKLGVRKYQVYAPPERGFLAKALTTDQHKVLDFVLGPEYAKSAVQLQEKLEKTTRIEESGERMVDLAVFFAKKGLPLHLSREPFHQACGTWAGKPRVFWVREGVAEKLSHAAEALRAINCSFRVEDAFRPEGVQEGLFFRRVQMILKEHPEWRNDFEKVWAEAKSKTAISPHMAGHKSGAALDLVILSPEGMPLPTGNRYPEGGAKSTLRYPYLTQEEWKAREMFAALMEMSGLRVYPFENWHASHGDLSAAISTGPLIDVEEGYTARYGPIKGFNPETGEIDPYSPEEYSAPFFTREETLARLESGE